MTQNPVTSRSSDGNPSMAARASLALSCVFLAILFVLHFLEPEFDPSWRMISEYEIGRFDWMMTLAFYCWGGRVLVLLVAISPSLRTTGGKICRWWLLVIGIALFGAGIFKTDAITDTTRSTAGNLHTLCGAIVILTFPLAASIVSRSLASTDGWAFSIEPPTAT